MLEDKAPGLESVSTQSPKIEGVEILSLIGRGATSNVFKARQLGMQRDVAVKVLANLYTDDDLARFKQEAKLTSNLDHPNIVKVFSFGLSEDGQPYLIMELLEGASLADELKEESPLRLSKFRDIFVPILKALAYAHESGLIHRDLKPGNIMLAKISDGSQSVKLLDFGIAKELNLDGAELQALTKAGSFIGSPAYMSPEQCRGEKLDYRCDIYSISCVMYEALCGETPFKAETVYEMMQQHCELAPPSAFELSTRFDLSKELSELILSGLAKEPSKRPFNASELALALSDILEKMTLDRLPRLKRKARARGKLPLLLLLLSCFGLSLFLLAVCNLSSRAPKAQMHTLDSLRSKSDFSKVKSLHENGILLAKKGRPKEALLLFQKAIELSKKNSLLSREFLPKLYVSAAYAASDSCGSDPAYEDKCNFYCSEGSKLKMHVDDFMILQFLRIQVLRRAASNLAVIDQALSCTAAAYGNNSHELLTVKNDAADIYLKHDLLGKSEALISQVLAIASRDFRGSSIELKAIANHALLLAKEKKRKESLQEVRHFAKTLSDTVCDVNTTERCLFLEGPICESLLLDQEPEAFEKIVLNELAANKTAYQDYFLDEARDYEALAKFFDQQSKWAKALHYHGLAAEIIINREPKSIEGQSRLDQYLHSMIADCNKLGLNERIKELVKTREVESRRKPER
ncbi:MAG: serine/threonine protein kinase [Candidatus Obscuribacterales bacterium]|nr:serine/threonine protein kinase [Candidatus Obscuribacterales bacterium]